MFGYNGFGRLTGNETGSVGGGGGRLAVGHHRPDPPVQRRLRRPDLVAAPGGAAPARRRARAHLERGRAPTARAPRSMLWGGWLLVTVGAVQLRQGHHPSLLHGRARPGDRRGHRDRRGHALVAPRALFAQSALIAVFAVTVVWSYVLLDRTPTWHPWLRASLAIGGFLVLAAMMAWRVPRSRASRPWSRPARLWSRCSARARTRWRPRRRRTAARSRRPARRSAGGVGPGRSRSAAVRRAAASRSGARFRSAARFRPAVSVRAAPLRAAFNSGWRRAGRVRRIRRSARTAAARGGGGLGGFLNGTTVSARSMKSLLATGSTRLPLGRGDGRRQQRGELPARDRASP